MKCLTNYLALLVLILAGVNLQGCKDDDEEILPAPPVPEITLETGAIGTNSVDLKLNNTDMTEYAWQVSTDLTTAAPSAAILFGTGTAGKLDEGENTITITGLEGNTEYMVFLATKSEKGFGEKVFSHRIKTAQYTELVTVTDRHFYGLSFHIEVPEGKHIGYALVDRELYLAFKEQFGYVDASFLTGMEQPPLDKSATITYTEIIDPDTDEPMPAFVPGQAIVLIVGEMQKGPDPWDPEEEAWVPCFDNEKFNGDGEEDPGPLQKNAPVDEFEEACWTGVHATVFDNAKAPEVVDAEIKLELVKRTTRTVEYAVTPDESVLGYCYGYLNMATWDMLGEMLDEDGRICWLTQNLPGYAVEPTQVTCNDLQAGITYKLVVIGKINEDGTKHTVKTVDFTAGEATKPVPVIEVKGIKAPEGETESPYTVWFNVKALNRDVVSARYLANSPGEWVKKLNSGATYMAMIKDYGAPFDESAVAAMNSEAGFNVSFSSWEDSWTRLVVCGYNDEEVCNSPDEDKRAVADQRTIEEPAAAPVTSALFDELPGEWTATATLYKRTYDAETKQYVDVVDSTPLTAKVVISQALDYPQACPEEVYPMYPGWKKEAVDSLYAEFLKSTEKYNRKCKQQNRLICEGLDITKYYTKYKSPYDLFIDETYSAYDNDELFYAFGPKWYLQIDPGDQVCVPTDLNRILPVSAWYSKTLYFSGVGTDGYDPTLKNLKVTVSDDKQTLTVEPAVVDGQTLYPSLISIMNGIPSSEAKCHSLVLTRGWSAASAKASVKQTDRNMPQEVQGMARFNRSRTYHRTRLGEVKVIRYKQAVVTPLSFEEVCKINLEKAGEKRPVR